MKTQQVISRFFATKPSSISAASTQNAPPSREDPIVSRAPKLSVQAATATLECPPRGRRRNFKPEFLPSSSKKRNAAIHISPENSPSSKRNGEVDNFESQPRKKRSPLVRKATGSLPDEPEATLAIMVRQSDEIGAVVPVSESDPEVLHTEDDQLDETPIADALFGAESCSQGADPPDNQLQYLEGALHPSDAKQRKASSIQEKRKEIPDFDPVKHKRFVETLLARMDANGDVQKSWYGSPPTGKEKLTPLEMQIVELKAKYPDVLLMVEVGYKYRFYGNDAETASRILGIAAYYDHNFLTAGIPTFRLHFHVRRLVEAGLKVGVVRQTETAAIKAHGSNKAGPFTRGLSALYTRATMEAAEDLGGGVPEGRITRLNSYLMCIAERPIQAGKKLIKKAKTLANEAKESERGIGEGNGSFDSEFGVVAIETATGDVMFGNFRDTVVRTELEGILITCSPAELLLASPLSSPTEKLLMEFAGPASEVRVERVSRDCFKDGGALAEVLDFYTAQDDLVKVDDEETEGKKADNGLEVVMRMPDIVVQALALALRYLKQFNLEKVLRLGTVFRPFSRHDEMNLSPNALRQLEILKNNTDDTQKGSLLWLMDHTETAFGARLLRYWVTHPLCDRTLIAARQDAVTEMAMSMGGLGAALAEGTFPGSGKGGGKGGGASRGSLQQGSIKGLLSMLGKMSDLERGLTRIFHRTATAAEFVSVIQALITSAKHLQQLQFHEQDGDSMMEEEAEEHSKKIRSPLLQRLISAVSSATLCEHAACLLSALNTDAATARDKLNLFKCTDGRFPEVAKCHLAIKVAETELDGYLPSFRKLLRIPKLQYISINGLSHLVEIPVAQSVPTNWMKVNSTKKTIRYHPPEVLKSRDKLSLAREQLGLACTRAWDLFLAEFASHYIDFRASVQALAALDCLHSLAIVSRNQGYTRPEFFEEDEPSQLMIQLGRHPILDSILEDAFVPNDTYLGGVKERCQIITGPNMGGKSCYIRQVALIVIMSQVGSYVPASMAKLHVFDSVQTRMGASDSLHKGASTFFEELSETSTILRTATSRSLVILDELGRGTSTHDGVAIAYATLQHILQEIRCLTLFVTHYPQINELKKEFPGEVNPYFVSYMARESEASTELAIVTGDEVDDLSSQSITFLYKLVPGAATRSFGLHVARLAKIPEACVLHAAKMAAKFEEVSEQNNLKATMLCIEGAPLKGIPLGEVDTKCLEDFEERHTLAIEDTKVALESSQTVSCSAKSTVENSAEPTGSSPASSSVDFRENAGPSECGHDDPMTRTRMRIAESELKELLLSIRNALHHSEDNEKCLSLLRDAQKRMQVAIG